jgi:hypothetical protein
MKILYEYSFQSSIIQPMRVITSFFKFWMKCTGYNFEYFFVFNCWFPLLKNQFNKSITTKKMLETSAMCKKRTVCIGSLKLFTIPLNSKKFKWKFFMNIHFKAQ